MTTVTFTQNQQSLIDAASYTLVRETIDQLEHISNDTGVVLNVADSIENIRMEMMRGSDALTARESRILSITLASLYSSIQYVPKKSLTLENHSGVGFLELTQESISEFAKKVWAQIVKAFQAFVAFIKRIFSVNVTTFNETSIKAEVIYKEAKKEPKSKEAPRPQNNNTTQTEEEPKAQRQDPVREEPKAQRQDPVREEPEIQKTTLPLHISLLLSLDTREVDDTKLITQKIKTFFESSRDTLNRRMHYPVTASIDSKEIIMSLLDKNLTDEKKAKDLDNFKRMVMSRFIDFANVDLKETVKSVEDFPVETENDVGPVYKFSVDDSEDMPNIKIGVRYINSSKGAVSVPLLTRKQCEELSFLVKGRAKSFVWISDVITKAVKECEQDIKRFSQNTENIEPDALRAIQKYYQSIMTMYSALIRMYHEESVLQAGIVAYAGLSLEKGAV